MKGSGAFEPDLTQWDHWYPAEVAPLFAGIKVPWYVAAGWSIDLFLGEQRGAHEDLEVAVPHDRVREVVAVLPGFDLFIPMEGPGNGLVCPFDEEHHQTWVREPTTGRWCLDIFRESSNGDTWISRRGPRIQRLYHNVIEFTPDGIPYARRRRCSSKRNTHISRRTRPTLPLSFRDSNQHVVAGWPSQLHLSTLSIHGLPCWPSDGHRAALDQCQKPPGAVKKAIASVQRSLR